MFSTFTFSQHFNISMIRIVWSTISSSNISDSVIYNILTILIFALGWKISCIDEYLKKVTAIFLIQKLCKAFLCFLAFLPMAIYLS